MRGGDLAGIPRPIPLSRELYDNLPQGTGGDDRMRSVDVGSEKAFFIKKWPELACFSKRRCLGKYLAVVRSAFA